MRNSSLNNINDIKRRENEPENESDKNNEDNIENKKAEETISENNIEVIMKQSDDSRIKANSVDAPSIVLKDMVIDMKDKVISKNKSKRSKWFKKFLRRTLKEPKNTGKSKNLNQRRKTKMCVLFSFGRCGYDDDDDDDDYYYDDEILDDPDPRGTYIITVLTIVGSMLFVTAVFLIIVYNVPRFFIVFHRPSLFLYITALGGLFLVYFSMLCLNCGYITPYSYILLCFTVLFASLVAAILLCSYEAVVVIHGFLAATAVVLTCIGLACTSFDFTSFWGLYNISALGYIACNCFPTFTGIHNGTANDTRRKKYRS
ncbi:unnamed protein product [Arctia plantaginis]|uniref:Uncharacterized protein n=1 Tax=Arctia plantaginis TaxID=874455 RepID=A0A8S0ZXG8_ARCPL|nr:unnamed protein product [Arctia plantaginis]